jgi:hypothetical protein
MRRRVCVRLAVLAIGLWAAGTVWAADPAVSDVTGKWKFFVGPRPADGRRATMELKQEGDKLTGKVILPGGMTQEIQDGKVTAKKITFFLQLGPKGAKVYHSGDVVGDKIKGKTEFEPPGKPRRAHFDWEAERATD